MKLTTSLSKALLYLFVLQLCFSATPVAAQKATGSNRQLRKEMDRVLNNPDWDNAFWGVMVQDLNSGKILYHRNETHSFIPASNTKLFTTSAALDQLGPDFRYDTNLYRTGDVVDHVLQGNLIIRGSGDPVIGGRFTDGDVTLFFRALADSIRNAGIYQINGDIIGDDDVFDDVALGNGWSWDDETYWYAAEISGLSFNDNCVDISIEGQTNGFPGMVDWVPAQSDYVQLINHTLTTAAGTSIVEGYDRSRGTNAIELYSKVPAGATDNESITVHNPTTYFAHVFRETLMRQGIPVLGHAVDVDDLSIKPNYEEDANITKVTRHQSPPLSDIIRALNKHSQNLYAEQVLKTLGAFVPVDSSDFIPGSAEMGIAAAMRTFALAGVDTSKLQLKDGSGMSRTNLVTPDMILHVLGYMWNHPDTSVAHAWKQSLPIGGVDGTLEHRFKDGSPAHGIVFAKTGTVSNASALSGYVKTSKGTPLAFAILANHFVVPTKQIREAQDALVNLLALYKK